MNKITLFIFSIAIGFLFSCDKEELTQVKDSDYLIFGNYFGNCEGESCVETFLLTDGKLYEDISDSYSRNTHFSFVELNNEKYESTKDLLDYFPKELLVEKKRSFGCPDCSGQGGIYIAYKKEGELKSWNIDPTKKQIPKYLHNFVDRVNSKLNQLHK